MNHFSIQQKLTQHCKSAIIQFKERKYIIKRIEQVSIEQHCKSAIIQFKERKYMIKRIEQVCPQNIGQVISPLFKICFT